MVLYYTPLFLGTPALPTLSYTGATGGVINSSGTHMFSGLSFGAENSARDIIVVAFGSAGTVPGDSPSSCTIGGISATKVVAGVTNPEWSQIWIAAVPTGTSGTVTLSGPSGNWSAVVGVYAANYLQSATATATDNHSGSPVTLGPTTVPTNGILVGTFGSAATSGTVGTASWTGGVTQDFDQNTFSAGGIGLSGASYIATSSASLSTSAAYSNGGLARGCWAAFR